MNKKALTPLMATILLLVFALVIGTITMNWGKNYVDTLAEDSIDSKELTISHIDEGIVKNVMRDYLDGKITKQEYDEKVKELSS